MSNEATASTVLTSVQTVRLEYEHQASGTTPVHARRGWRVLWLVVLLPGLVVPFVPFACDTSAAEMVWKGGAELIQKPSGMEAGALAMWLLAFPFFVVFSLVLWKLLRMFGARPARWAARVGLSVGTLGTLFFIASIAGAARAAATPYEWALVSGGAVGIALAVSLAIALRVRPGGRDDAVEVALLGPYVMTLLFAIACWWKEAEIDWWLALAPAAGGLVELLMTGWFVWRTRNRRRSSSSSLAD
jgi:hypothetical protein